MNLKKATIILLISSFLVLLLAITGCNNTKQYLQEINYDTLKDKIDNKQDFILYVANKSCSHCKAYEPKFREVINKYKITVYKIDTAKITTTQNDELEGIVGSLSTPTVMFFYDGIESGSANRIAGDVSKDNTIEHFKANGYIEK